MNTNERPEMTEKQSCHWYLAFTASRAEQRVKQELDQRKVRNSSLRPYLDVIVRHSAVIRNIRIDYSSKHLGLSCSGMAGGKLSTIVFSNGYRCGMDTRLLGIRHNGSCNRRSFDWVSGRTGYFGHRVSDKDPFSFYGMFSCCCT